jgi:hypothetical protein
MKNLKEVEDMDFAYTTISLNKTYQMGFKQALQLIERGGGKVEGDRLTIRCQQPQPVRYEKGFEGHFPTKRINIRKNIDPTADFDFEGVGFVVKGGVRCTDRTYVANVEVYLDGQLMEVAKLPANGLTRRNELTWKYQLPKGAHKVSFKWLNPRPDATVNASEVLTYNDSIKN